jgi:formate hydrogenlyase transcriptional activator
MAAEERDALVEINRTVVVGSMTIEELMPVVRDVLKRVIRQDMTGLVQFVQSPEGPWFDIRYRDGVDIDLRALRQFPFEQMAPAEMMATGKPLLLTGYNQDRFAERHYIESVGILSCTLCPLIVRDAAYGFLAIGSRRRNAFSDRDLRLAEQVGIQLSHAIANLDAYGEIRSLKEQLERENVYLRNEISASIDFKELIGDSPALQKTLKAIEQVAPTDSTVLITGETGTGKELVARAIHQLSSRKDRPLVTVNCAALPPTLIESELFGHEKGAFTSAAARKIGRFEVADGGTIVLDEIGELPLDLQAKLLRVLESHELQRVGGSQTIKLNLRVVAATNVDLAQAVKQGTFRSDLYYRLNVFPVRIPPLRERREDIPTLARHFVRKYGARYRKSITRIGQDTLKALSSFDWPGNVRELEHVIERAVIVSQGTRLIVDEFEAENTDPERTSPRTLAEAERRHILEALRQTNWVLAGQYGAASRLGMKRSTLQHRMKKLGIRRAVSRSK